MTLIKSISGIRGTLGGKTGEGLTPLDTVRFSSAYGMWIKRRSRKSRPHVILGRDARPSGPLVADLVRASLNGLGIEVTDLRLATTPTVEMAVPEEQADGGIIITASHNPVQWNALKLLNEQGEFLTAEDGREVLEIAEKEDFQFAEVENLGGYREADYADFHIQKILELELVDRGAIAAAGFIVAIDAVNSVGGIILPELLRELGVAKVIELYTEPTGYFPHNPEPLPAHVGDIMVTVKNSGADLGFVVDPDVDRLAVISEDGSMFGEEYTLVAVADYVLQHTPGNTVSNLSSTRALRDLSLKYGGSYQASPVGEVNVVALMKEQRAVIGGEGNGGVIYPPLHYGRDALVGIALFLSGLAKRKTRCSEWRASLPSYVISKNRIDLQADMDVDEVLARVREKYRDAQIDVRDGVKIDFAEGWIHLRKSNTEPIIRVYAEGRDAEASEAYARELMLFVKGL